MLAQPASSPSLAAAVPLGRAPSFSPFPLRQSFESHGKWRYSAVVRRGALNVPALFFRRVAASNGVRSREACRSETRSPGIVDVCRVHRRTSDSRLRAHDVIVAPAYKVQWALRHESVAPTRLALQGRLRSHGSSRTTSAATNGTTAGKK